jgi:hypothetical protein
MSGTRRGTILAPLDAANLQNFGLLRPAANSGSRRLHKRRLNRSSDEENEFTPLQIPPDSPEAVDAFATIPEHLFSRETLIHIGLSEEKADELWDRWTNWPADGPRREVDSDDGGLEVSFLDMVIGSIESKRDVLDDNDPQWRACMDACGIARNVQDAIMDHHFKYIRLSNSCLYWVLDTIEMRYCGLQDIQRTSWAREMELQRMASRSMSSGHQRGHGSTAAGSQQRSVSGHQQQGTARISAKVWGSASAMAARHAPGYTVLFKAIDQARISGLFDNTGALSDIGVLLSLPPTDFNRGVAFYFTPDYEVAEVYAAFAKRRTNCESVVIVCFRLRNAAIEALQEPDLQRLYWPSHEWKQLVWYCRRIKPLLSHLRKYRNSVLIIGTVASKPALAYHKLDSWELVSEEHVLRVGRNGEGRLAVQYVVSGEQEGWDFLLENGARDSMTLFPYPAAELDSWLAENN